MICDKVNKNTIGNTSIPILPLIDKAIEFIGKYLPSFPNSLKIDINNTAPKDETEKLLNQSLVDFFNGHSQKFTPYLQCKFLFRKDDENRGTNYRPDIGITIWNEKTENSETKSFFQIECKRLPIPNTSKSRSEMEYVIGIEKNTGGIERFKNKKHGAHLDVSAMIGFIQDETTSEWYNYINEWIKIQIDIHSPNWTKDDYLINESSSSLLSKSTSICKRDELDSIVLHHFLLNMQ